MWTLSTRKYSYESLRLLNLMVQGLSDSWQVLRIIYEPLQPIQASTTDFKACKTVLSRDRTSNTRPLSRPSTGPGHRRHSCLSLDLRQRLGLTLGTDPWPKHPIPHNGPLCLASGEDDLNNAAVPEVMSSCSNASSRKACHWHHWTGWPARGGP